MSGKVWKFGDDVNTDEIIPAIYLNMTDPAELAKYCMAGVDEQFSEKASAGDVIVGGRNFGCGSSREHAPICIKALDIPCVVAESFARIFFRNAINIGLPIAECPEAARDAAEGDQMSVDFSSGTVTNETQGKTYSFDPFPDQLQAIIDAGGLIPYAKQTAK